jgi:uncharacterized protein DUF4232
VIRLGWLVAVLLLVGGCGTEVATDAAPRRTPDADPTVATPTPKPTLPPAKCPPSGGAITVGPVDPALGHRAVTVKLTNCGSKTLVVEGYPEVAVLNARREKFKLTVAHGSSYMATDPGPTRIRLARGKSVLASVAWSNTVTYGDNQSGAYFAISWRKGVPPVIWPEYVDIGTTGKITLTAWNPKPA